MYYVFQVLWYTYSDSASNYFFLSKVMVLMEVWSFSFVSLPGFPSFLFCIIVRVVNHYIFPHCRMEVQSLEVIPI